jgi:acyl-phosphate glycerol 3-phosphate acyltransferase
MSSDTTFNTFLLAAAMAFALGALPSAYIIGRLNGINVFKVGSRQAGATNIWREVSRKQGVIVTLIDFSKGVAAILIARYLALESVELLIPTTAAIAGHWNSPFTKFKGGDGVVTLVGTAIVIAPIMVFIGLLVGSALAVSMNKKLKHPSLLGGIAGYITFIWLSFSPNSNVDPIVVYGLTAIGISIMLHSMYFHRRHKDYFQLERPIEEDPEPTFRQDGLG